MQEERELFAFCTETPCDSTSAYHGSQRRACAASNMPLTSAVVCGDCRVAWHSLRVVWLTYRCHPAGPRHLGSRERHRRAPGRVPDAAEGAEQPDAQPDGDGRCVTWRPRAAACKMSPRHGTEPHGCGVQPKRVAALRSGNALLQRPVWVARSLASLSCTVRATFLTSQHVSEAGPSRVPRRRSSRTRPGRGKTAEQPDTTGVPSNPARHPLSTSRFAPGGVGGRATYAYHTAFGASEKIRHLPYLPTQLYLAACNMQISRCKRGLLQLTQVARPIGW
jgi:hypothetical protein